MGFQDLFKAWMGKGLLSQTLTEFVKMIETTEWMYRTALTTLWDEPDQGEKKKAIRERDIHVNKTERSLRKKIVEHLAINPGSDVNYCLILMSVVKDVERLGDYAKNLVEVGGYHATCRDDNALTQELKRIQRELGSMYEKVGKTFRESDEMSAKFLVRKELELTKACDALVSQILKTEGLTIPQAVSYTLLARFLKRIAAHIGNVASSVIMPLHKLDYYDEEYLPDTRFERGNEAVD